MINKLFLIFCKCVYHSYPFCFFSLCLVLKFGVILNGLDCLEYVCPILIFWSSYVLS